MRYRLLQLLLACLPLFILAGCADAQDSPPVEPKGQSAVQTLASAEPGGDAGEQGRRGPQPGTEADYFRAVDVFIHINPEERMIKVVADEQDENVLYQMPRIFYPPDGKGERVTVENKCRPERPARQVRWLTVCDTGQCDGHYVVVRPKAGHPERNRYCKKEGVRWIEPEIYECPMKDPCCHHGTEPKDSKAMDGFKKEKKEHDRRQARRVFSANTGGVFMIPIGPGGLDRCPECGNGAVLSGIPNVRGFFQKGRSFGWSYAVELWREGSDQPLACLDPDVWIEADG